MNAVVNDAQVFGPYYNAEWEDGYPHDCDVCGGSGYDFVDDFCGCCQIEATCEACDGTGNKSGEGQTWQERFEEYERKEREEWEAKQRAKRRELLDRVAAEIGGDARVRGATEEIVVSAGSTTVRAVLGTSDAFTVYVHRADESVYGYGVAASWELSRLVRLIDAVA